MKQKELAEFLMEELRNLRHQIMRQVSLEGLSFQQFHFLKILLHHEGDAMSFYANHLKLSKPNFSKMVTLALEKSWVFRREDELDRRMVRLFLLPKGRELIRKNMDILHKESFRLLEKLDKEDQEALNYHLQEAFRVLKKIR